MSVKNLGIQKSIEFAQDPTFDQIVSFFQGEGAATVELLETLEKRCPSVEKKLEPWKSMWLTRDEETPPYLGLNNHVDIQFGTDNIVKTLARCTGSCVECVFATVADLTISGATKIKV